MNKRIFVELRAIANLLDFNTRLINRCEQFNPDQLFYHYNIPDFDVIRIDIMNTVSNEAIRYIILELFMKQVKQCSYFLPEELRYEYTDDITSPVQTPSLTFVYKMYDKFGPYTVYLAWMGGRPGPANAPKDIIRMIKEVKLKRTKKIKKNGKRKNNKKIKLSKKHSSFQYKLEEKKEEKKDEKKEEKKEMKKEEKKEMKKEEKKEDKYESKQFKKDNNKKYNKNIKIKGGGTNNNCKEKFEVKRLSDIDYSQFSLAKSADPDWGNSPGPPPMDCCLM
jgi:hypothetical protein